MSHYAATVPIAPAIQQAIDEVRRVFADHEVDVSGDDQGGAYVVVHGLDIGDRYAQGESWLGFHISNLYPAADVYPHYVRPDMSCRDGQALGTGFAATVWTFRNQPVTQLSRRSNRWDPRRDSAAMKALKVLHWLRNPS